MCADFYGEQAFAGIFAAQRAGKPGKRGHSMRKKQAQTKAAALTNRKGKCGQTFLFGNINFGNAAFVLAANALT